jgi:DNA-binding Xre family transcriptional regulator
MLDEERYKLLHGPYQPPAVGIGDRLQCELRGDVVVKAWSDAIIPWPCVRIGGRPGFILCGDLVRAVKCESSLAIQHWWGVSDVTVTQWRKALHVQKVNEGTQRLYRDYKPETLTDEIVKRALEKAHSLDVRLKAQQTRQQRGKQPNLRPWTAEEEQLLGTMTDAEVAQRIGRAVANVGIHRRGLGIPAYAQKRSACALNGRDTVRLDPTKLKARRLALGLAQREVGVRASMNSLMLSPLETGKRRRVLRQTLEKLATALECSPQDLVASDTTTAPAPSVKQENGALDV